MIGEISHFALILAFILAMIQTTALWWKGNTATILSQSAVWGQGCLVLLAFGGLIAAFVGNDFSILYTANNSNHDMPLLYRVSAVWGAHEGSLLLWVLILAGWSLLIAVSPHFASLYERALTLAVMGVVSSGMYAFILFTSNPFVRLLPPPPSGKSLNPLLQDPGLAFHPPMLYLGYVGLAAPFALVCASLISGYVERAWLRLMRIFTAAAWLFLTLGIALGSWWAYNELGWGGWWFWDPVENASFMPWLAATALLHALVVSERSGHLLRWSYLLAICAFALSLLGTFLVRSGVITSVHAFASDPTRGLFMLGFMALIIGAALILFVWRAPMLERPLQYFSPLSRESALTLNNVVLCTMTATVLLGTIYPLLADALQWGKVSVGAPYFDALFAPLGALLLVLLGFGVHLRTRKDRWRRLSLPLVQGLLAAGAMAVFIYAFFVPRLSALWGFALAAWVLWGTGYQLWQRWNSGNLWRAGFLGMSIAHIGFAIFVIGVCAVKLFSLVEDVRLAPGMSHQLGDYTFTFAGSTVRKEANYQLQEGKVWITRGTFRATLFPQKRDYVNSVSPLTEAATHITLWRDLYLSLGEPFADGSWTMRIQIKPLVRWIWGGAALMALGALFAVTGHLNYLRRVRVN